MGLESRSECVEQGGKAKKNLTCASGAFETQASCRSPPFLFFVVFAQV